MGDHHGAGRRHTGKRHEDQPELGTRAGANKGRAVLGAGFGRVLVFGTAFKHACPREHRGYPDQHNRPRETQNRAPPADGIGQKRPRRIGQCRGKARDQGDPRDPFAGLVVRGPRHKGKTGLIKAHALSHPKTQPRQKKHRIVRRACKNQQRHRPKRHAPRQQPPAPSRVHHPARKG